MFDHVRLKTCIVRRRLRVTYEDSSHESTPHVSYTKVDASIRCHIAHPNTYETPHTQFAVHNASEHWLKQTWCIRGLWIGGKQVEEGVLQSGQQLMKYWCAMRVTSFRQIASGLAGKPRTEFSRNASLHVRIAMTSSRWVRGPIARLSRTAPDRRKARRRPQRSAASCGHTKRTQAHKKSSLTKRSRLA